MVNVLSLSLKSIFADEIRCFKKTRRVIFKAEFKSDVKIRIFTRINATESYLIVCNRSIIAKVVNNFFLEKNILVVE